MYHLPSTASFNRRLNGSLRFLRRILVPYSIFKFKLTTQLLNTAEESGWLRFL